MLSILVLIPTCILSILFFLPRTQLILLWSSFYNYCIVRTLPFILWYFITHATSILFYLSLVRAWPGVFGLSWGCHPAAHLSPLGHPLFLHAADAGNWQPGKDDKQNFQKLSKFLLLDHSSIYQMNGVFCFWVETFIKHCYYSVTLSYTCHSFWPDVFIMTAVYYLTLFRHDSAISPVLHRGRLHHCTGWWIPPGSPKTQRDLHCCRLPYFLHHWTVQHHPGTFLFLIGQICQFSETLLASLFKNTQNTSRVAVGNCWHIQNSVSTFSLVYQAPNYYINIICRYFQAFVLVYFS